MSLVSATLRDFTEKDRALAFINSLPDDAVVSCEMSTRTPGDQWDVKVGNPAFPEFPNGMAQRVRMSTPEEGTLTITYRR